MRSSFTSYRSPDTLSAEHEPRAADSQRHADAGETTAGLRRFFSGKLAKITRALAFTAALTSSVPALTGCSGSPSTQAAAPTNSESQQPTSYAVARETTPVFYLPDICGDIFGGKDGKTLVLDEFNQIDPLEFEAFAGTPFNVLGCNFRSGNNTICQVTTPDYPYDPPEGKGHFVSASFLEFGDSPFPPRTKVLPSREAIINTALTLQGDEYGWGVNYPPGVRMTEICPPSEPLSAELEEKWNLKNRADCSGLPYYLTDGWTPRNTSDLTHYGVGVEIEGLSPEEIAEKLQPLDLIAWSGHTMMVIEGGTKGGIKGDGDGDGTEIESRHDYEPDVPGFQGGVRVRGLVDVLKETESLKGRHPVNKYPADKNAAKSVYVVQRWYPQE